MALVIVIPKEGHARGHARPSFGTTATLKKKKKKFKNFHKKKNFKRI